MSMMSMLSSNKTKIVPVRNFLSVVLLEDSLKPCLNVCGDLVCDAELAFMTKGQPPFLSGVDIRHPQVVGVDEGDETGLPGTDLGVHANP